MIWCILFSKSFREVISSKVYPRFIAYVQWQKSWNYPLHYETKTCTVVSLPAASFYLSQLTWTWTFEIFWSLSLQLLRILHNTLLLPSLAYPLILFNITENFGAFLFEISKGWTSQRPSPILISNLSAFIQCKNTFNKLELPEFQIPFQKHVCKRRQNTDKTRKYSPFQIYRAYTFANSNLY